MSEVLFDASGISKTGTLLARYELEDGFREVMGYRVDGEIAVYDVPFPRTEGGTLVVERGVFWEETLEGLVREYVRHSEELGCPAASDEATAQFVAELDADEAEMLLGAGAQ